MNRSLIARLFAGLLLCLAVPSLAEEEKAEAQEKPPKPCATEEYRQFDFWVGHWDVYAKDKLAGTNRITRVYNDCALREDYETPGGYVGGSWNIYDASTGQWHQTWVDSAGTLLQMDGGLKDGSMVLAGKRQTPKGSVIDRITFTPLASGHVRQHWELSADDGKTWQTLFDGEYRRKSE